MTADPLAATFDSGSPMVDGASTPQAVHSSRVPLGDPFAPGDVQPQPSSMIQFRRSVTCSDI